MCGWAAVGANTLHTRTRARARITSQRRWPEVSRPRALSFNHPRPGFSIADGSVPQFGFESVFTMTGKKLEKKKKKTSTRLFVDVTTARAGQDTSDFMRGNDRHPTGKRGPCGKITA